MCSREVHNNNIVQSQASLLFVKSNSYKKNIWRFNSNWIHFHRPIPYNLLTKSITNLKLYSMRNTIKNTVNTWDSADKNSETSIDPLEVPSSSLTSNSNVSVLSHGFKAVQLS